MTATTADKPRLATIALTGCFGCHMSLLDIDERLLELLLERI
jgi:NAD-reducing hydrogenase small subunit